MRTTREKLPLVPPGLEGDGRRASLPLISVSHLSQKPQSQGFDAPEVDDEEDAEDVAKQLVSRTFEGKIHLKQLKKLKTFFDNSANCGGSLDEDQFVQAFTQVSQGRISHETLREFFIRIDANANGFVDWDEFSTYLLLEGQQEKIEHKTMEEFTRQRFPHPPRDVRHTDAITRILVNKDTGKYYTASSDGTLKVWSSKCAYEKTLHNGTCWITDACWLPTRTKQQRLMLSSMDRKIYLYDIRTENIVRYFCGQTKLDGMVTKDFGSWLRSQISNVPAKESTRGAEFRIKVSDADKIDEPLGGRSAPITLNGLMDYATALHCCELKEFPDIAEIMLLGLRSGRLLAYPVVTTSSITELNPLSSVSIHNSTISKAMYSEFLNGVVTASWDTSIKITNLEAGVTVKTLGGYNNPNGHSKSIYSFDWCPDLKLIASCGSERTVFVWNPHMSNPVFKLEGHASSLVDVRFNKDQLITVSTDRLIKVFDVRTFNCLQTFGDNGNTNATSEGAVSSLAYDNKRQRIVTGWSHPVIWPVRKQTTQFGVNYVGHIKPVIAALYNRQFKQVVSADRDTVITWDAKTGAKIFVFRVRSFLTEDDDHISSLAFDENGRRLIIGTRHGVIMLWNYINGQPLTDLRRIGGQDGGTEVSGCVHLVNKMQQLRYVAAAVGNTCVLLEDSDAGVREKDSFHHDDYVITSMAVCGPTTIAYATDGGNIVVLSLLLVKAVGVIDCHDDPDSLFTIEALVYLKTKENILLAGRSDGYIQVWNLKHRSLLHTCQVAASNLLNFMATNDLCTWLCVADQTGTVTTIDISQLPDSPQDIRPVDAEMLVRRRTFKTNDQTVTSIGFVDEYDYVLTTSVDCSVKIFTVDGILIGRFGQNDSWDLSDFDTFIGTRMHTPAPEKKIRGRKNSELLFLPDIVQRFRSCSKPPTTMATVVAKVVEGQRALKETPQSPRSPTSNMTQRTRSDWSGSQTSSRAGLLPAVRIRPPPALPQPKDIRPSMIRPYRRNQALSGIVKRSAISELSRQKSESGDHILMRAKALTPMAPMQPRPAAEDGYERPAGAHRALKMVAVDDKGDHLSALESTPSSSLGSPISGSPQPLGS